MCVARVAMLELSTSFRRHVNLTMRDMFVLMSAPHHEDAVWRGKLHELARWTGGTDEVLTLFCGITDLRGRAGCFGLAHEHEDIRLHVLPEADVLAGLAAGAYNNAATIVCLQWLALNRDRLHGLATHGRRDP